MSRFYIPRKFIYDPNLNNISNTNANANTNVNSSINNDSLQNNNNINNNNSINAINAINSMNNMGSAWYYEFGFDLLSMGGSEYYHKTKGLASQPGFEKFNCFLMRWDIPVPSTIYTFYLSLKAKSTRWRENCMFYFLFIIFV